MKTFNKSILSMFALATVVMASCSDNDTWNEENGPDPSKELISFSSQDGQIGTRAVFEGTRAGFSSQTKIVMRIKAEDDQNTTTAKLSRYTRTCAVGDVQTSSDECNNSTLLGNSLTHSHLTFVSPNFRYWDDAFGRYSKLSVYAVCVPNKNGNGILADDILPDNGTAVDATNNPHWKTETTEAKTLEWEVPSTEQNSSTIEEKDLCYSNNIRSGAGENEKGVYRHSYSSADNSWSKSLKAGQMYWYGTDGKSGKESAVTSGKFDEGHLIFKHALCKVTIQLTENTGFNNSSNTDFKFKDGTNVKLLDFPYTGTLDFTTGNWDSTTKGVISKLHEITSVDDNGNPTEAKTVRKVTGLTLPGKVLYNDNNNSLHFIIDNNDYYVTGNTIAEAIRKYYDTGGEGANDSKASELKTFTTMKQGHHYLINITVNKSEIKNVTAQLIGWEEVQTSPIEPSNAYINVSLENNTNGTEITENKFDIYRKASKNTNLDKDTYISFADYEWKTGYNDKASSLSYSSGAWNTGWNWPDNLTYYHIRAVGDNTSSSPSCPNVETDATNGDYFSIKSGNITGKDYRDYIWGAPFKQTNDKLSYSIKNGFDGTTSENNSDSHQIYKAIGATNDVINMLFFHMTAQVIFNITTTTGDNRVTLRSGTESPYTQTKVEILRFFTDGTVRVGNGCVEPVTNETSALTNNQEVEFEEYTPESGGTAAISKHRYGVVPQTLNRESGTDAGRTIGLRITTPDNNQYVIEDISTVLASSVSNNNIQNPYTSTTVGTDTKFIIDRWYPGYIYTYTIRITKKGIDKITAQLLDWETVKSDDIDIDLEGK